MEFCCYKKTWSKYTASAIVNGDSKYSNPCKELQTNHLLTSSKQKIPVYRYGARRGLDLNQTRSQYGGPAACHKQLKQVRAALMAIVGGRVPVTSPSMTHVSCLLRHLSTAVFAGATNVFNAMVEYLIWWWRNINWTKWNHTMFLTNVYDGRPDRNELSRLSRVLDYLNIS